MSAPVQPEETLEEDGNMGPEPGVEAEDELEWVFPAADSPTRDGFSLSDFDDWLKLDSDASDSIPEPPAPRHPHHDCERCRDGHRLHTHTFGHANLKRDKPILSDTTSRYPTLRQMTHANISDDFQRVKGAIEAFVLSLETQFGPQTPRNANVRRRRDETHASDRSRRMQATLNQYSLIHGAPENQVLWNNHRPLLLQGATWSILLDTLLRNKFAVFGNRAQHLAQEWATKDYDTISATWRRITAEQLLIRCGIAQCEFIGVEILGNSLRALLHNVQSLEHTRRELTNALMAYRHSRYSEEKWQDARNDVAVNLQEADPVARQSVHETRAQFVMSMKNWAGSTSASQIEEVATHAQVLAIHMAVNSRSYDLIVPVLGQKIDHLQHSPASSCTLSRAGHIVFAVHPGIEGRQAPEDRNIFSIRRAQVYHDGSLDDAGIPESSTPRLDPRLETATMQNGHIPAPPREIPKDLSETDPPILPRFTKLQRDILSFVRSVDTYPELDQQRELRHFTISDDNAHIPWKELQKKHMYRESAIWNVLEGLLDMNTFGILGNYNDRLSLSRIIYSEDGNNETVKREQNQWRWLSANQMVARLGGAKALAKSNKVDVDKVQDNELFQHVKRRIEEVYSVIAARLLGRIPQEPLEKLQLIVEEAALLSAMILVRPSLFVVFRPEINKRIIHWDKSEMELTDRYPSDQEGRVTFVVSPGLSEIGDPKGRNLDHNPPKYHAPCVVRLDGQHSAATQDTTEADSTVR